MLPVLINFLHFINQFSMEIFNTIIPIFAVIFVGWFAGYKNFFPKTFLGPANRIVFYIAIPAMIFSAVSKADFHENFNPGALAAALISLTLAYLLAWMAGVGLKLRNGNLGSFIQSSAHSNIGYIAFAVSYYYLGNEGLAATGLFAGFIMILQNLYSVAALVASAGRGKPQRGIGSSILTQITLNPIIISAAGGIFFSVAEISMPLFISRALDILGGMGLPTALLIIGASLSSRLVKTRLAAVLTSCAIKMILLPGIALGLFWLWGIPKAQHLPILIILASPTATVAYVMAGEMGGDPDLAAAVISLCTVLSSATFVFWLHIA
jgi:predicted permease